MLSRTRPFTKALARLPLAGEAFITPLCQEFISSSSKEELTGIMRKFSLTLTLWQAGHSYQAASGAKELARDTAEYMATGNPIKLAEIGLDAAYALVNASVICSHTVLFLLMWKKYAKDSERIIKNREPNTIPFAHRHNHSRKIQCVAFNLAAQLLFSKTQNARKPAEPLNQRLDKISLSLGEQGENRKKLIELLNGNVKPAGKELV